MLIQMHLGGKSLDLLLDASLALGLGELAAAVLLGLLLPVVLGLLLALTLNLLEGILADLLVGVLVELLDTVGLNVVVDVSLELGLVALLIIVGKGLHVLGNVTTEDVLAEGLGVELLGLNVEAGETLLGVGDVKTTVRGTLHGGEDTGTSGGAGQTDIKEDLEGAALLTVDLGGLGQGELAIGLLDTSEGLLDTELVEGTAGDEKTNAVSRGPVGKTVLDAVGLELVGVGRDEDLVTSDLGRDDLADDVAVGEADDQAVLGGVVLVLGLGDEALASVVVGLSRTSSAVLDLEAPDEKELLAPRESIAKHVHLREVGLVLDQLGLLSSPSQQLALQKFPKHLAGTLCHQGNGRDTLEEQAVILTKGILTVGGCLVWRGRKARKRNLCDRYKRVRLHKKTLGKSLVRNRERDASLHTRTSRQQPHFCT